MIIILNHVVCYPHPTTITQRSSSSIHGYNAYDYFVLNSINLFYHCQLISLSILFDPIKQSNRAVIALDQSRLKKLINVQLYT